MNNNVMKAASGRRSQHNTFDRISQKFNRGMSLLVVIIMIGIMSMMVIVAFRLNKDSLQISRNLQSSLQTLNVARSAAEEVISNANFTVDPSKAFNGGPGCADPSTTNIKCYSLSNSGTSDVVVTLTPQPCIKASRVRLNSELNLALDSDLGCAISAQQGTFGMAGASTNNNSLCANSTWEINASAQDSVMNASAVYTQGVTVQISADSAYTTSYSCP